MPPRKLAAEAQPTGRPARGRYAPVVRVNVYLWGMHAGAAARDPSTGYYAFNYTPEFRRTGIEPAPLRMPTAGGPYVFPELHAVTWHRLPAMLGDALPDDFGNALIDAYMAERGVRSEQVTPLDRLAYMGARSMGALTFQPARGPTIHQATPIEMGALVDKARQAVHGTLQDDGQAVRALKTLIDVGTSAGGARAKAVIAYNPQTREIRSGQFDAPPGFEHWLLKFDGMGRDKELGAAQAYGRIEYAYHLMARAAGIEMSDCRLLEEGGRAHFMTRRFDREAGNVRHHTQTLCAMDHLNYKLKEANSYAQWFLTLDKLDLPYEAFEEAFRRMVFNVMGRNCDDHTKNISFCLRQAGRWELAPAYDVTFAHNPQGEWTRQHLMAVNGRFRDPTEGDLLAMAERSAIGSARKVIGQVRAAIRRWPEFAAAARVPSDVMEEIGRQQLLLLPG